MGPAAVIIDECVFVRMALRVLLCVCAYLLPLLVPSER